jgi:phosphatidylserine/phosphatidylglycerophosphate/cardiolipin synthase-like enzyme
MLIAERRAAADPQCCGFACAQSNPVTWAPASPVFSQTTSAWAKVSWTGDSSNCSGASKAAYDHQNVTYAATRTPLAPAAYSGASIVPFFSPDTSDPSLVDLVDGATASLDILTPSASPWTYACSTRIMSNGCVTGCDAATMRADAFPLFGALLNALHRGVAVRIITNDFGAADCTNGNLTMLSFLALNGADVRSFTTLSFMHAKVIGVDLQSTSATPKVAVSSVNWSKSSINKNREAGAILAGTAAAPLATYVRELFESDFSSATPLVVATSSFSAAALATITDTSLINVTVPPSPHATPSASATCFNAATLGVNTSHPIILDDDARVSLAASPDGAYSTLATRLRASSLLEVYMYQITEDVCDLLVELASDAARTLRVLVSGRIYDVCDCEAAQTCYRRLSAAGVTLRVGSSSCFNYAHQKLWIVDGSSVGWSTGNWGPSDFPSAASDQYPPYGLAGWRKTNRDLSVYVDDAPTVVQTFRTVMYQVRQGVERAPWVWVRMVAWKRGWDAGVGRGWMMAWRGVVWAAVQRREVIGTPIGHGPATADAPGCSMRAIRRIGQVRTRPTGRSTRTCDAAFE